MLGHGYYSNRFIRNWDNLHSNEPIFALPLPYASCTGFSKQVIFECTTLRRRKRPSFFDAQPSEVKIPHGNLANRPRASRIPHRNLANRPRASKIPHRNLANRARASRIPHGNLANRPRASRIPHGNLANRPRASRIPHGNLANRPLASKIPHGILTNRPLGEGSHALYRPRSEGVAGERPRAFAP